MTDEANGGSGMERWFWVALGVVALGGVAFLVTGGGGGPDPIGPLSQADVNAEADSGAYAAAIGPEDAPVTLMEFADYQCGHCARFAALPGPAIRRDFVQPGQVRMLLYDFPLSQQSNAIPAALAARCAGAQGQYWQMHELLFSNQQSWARDQSPEDRFADYADRIGLDGGEFDACYSERRFLDEIMASRAFGRELGVGGTPAIYVNGRETGNYGYEAVAGMIEAALDSVSAGDSATAASSGAGATPGEASAR